MCTGFEVVTPQGPMIVKAHLLLCSVDLPAKAIVLNCKQFNGEYGCSYCEDEGVPRATTHLHRNWPYSSCSVPRTHRGILANAREALHTKAPVSDIKILCTCIQKCACTRNMHMCILQVKGVKGASVLAAHPHFDLCRGMVIDVMHCVYLGVIAKTLMGLWLNVEHRSAPYSIRRQVNARLAHTEHSI